MLAVYGITYGDTYRGKEKGIGSLSIRHLLSSDNLIQMKQYIYSLFSNERFNIWFPKRVGNTAVKHRTIGLQISTHSEDTIKILAEFFPCQSPGQLLVVNYTHR